MINLDALFECVACGAGLFDALRTCQVDEVELGGDVLLTSDWFVTLCSLSICRLRHLDYLLLDSHGEDGVRARRCLVHKRRASHAMCNAFVKQLNAFLASVDDFSLEAGHADRTFFVLSNPDIFCSLLPSGLIDGAAMVQQVANVVTIQLKELYLDREFAELRLFTAILDFAEDKVEDARHDTDLLRRQAYGAASAHCVRLARAGHAVGEDSRIIAIKASEDQVARTDLKDVLLVSLFVEDTIKSERRRVDLQLVQLRLSFDALFHSTIAQLATHQRPDTHCYFHGTCLRKRIGIRQLVAEKNCDSDEAKHQTGWLTWSLASEKKPLGFISVSSYSFDSAAAGANRLSPPPPVSISILSSGAAAAAPIIILSSAASTMLAVCSCLV